MGGRTGQLDFDFLSHSPTGRAGGLPLSASEAWMIVDELRESIQRNKQELDRFLLRS
jgi:hypothetical protein